MGKKPEGCVSAEVKADSMLRTQHAVQIRPVKRKESGEADLEARYEPSRENRSKAAAAKAEADYAVAGESATIRPVTQKTFAWKRQKPPRPPQRPMPSG